MYPLNMNYSYARALRGLGDLIPCSSQPAGVVQNPGVNCLADPWYAWFLTTTGLLVTGGGVAAYFYFRKKKKK
jgi:hypothetical protein